jgi:GYD domain
VKDVFWTLGEYDIVAVVEAPDDVSITALGLSTGALGNVRTRPCERLRRPTWGQSLTRWSRVEFRAAGPSCCRCWSPNLTRRKHHGARTNGGKPCPSPATKKGCCRLHGGHRHSAVCLCVYIDETMRGDSVVASGYFTPQIHVRMPSYRSRDAGGGCPNPPSLAVGHIFVIGTSGVWLGGHRMASHCGRGRLSQG